MQNHIQMYQTKLTASFGRLESTSKSVSDYTTKINETQTDLINKTAAAAKAATGAAD